MTVTASSQGCWPLRWCSAPLLLAAGSPGDLSGKKRTTKKSRCARGKGGKRTWSSDRDSWWRGEQRAPGSWVCASPGKRNTGLPESRRRVRGRSVFMRKWQVAGCSAEEEKREREPTSKELPYERPVPLG